MNNEIREKDHEWVMMFHSSIDRLLVSIEKLFENRQPGAVQRWTADLQGGRPYLENEPKNT